MLTGVHELNAFLVEVLETGGAGHLWTGAGPTPEARAVRDGGAAADEATRTWVLLAWALYDGSGGLTVARLFETLSETRLPIALSLLLRAAMRAPRADDAIDSDAAASGRGALH